MDSEQPMDGTSMVVSMLSAEFDRVRVMDPGLRRSVVKRLLEDADFIGETLGKYELDALLRGEKGCTETVLEEQAKTLTLSLFLTPDEQTNLSKHNRDVRLLFEPGRTMPHAYYWAQRIIDTDRCLRMLCRNGGDIIDIGGNYASHARQGSVRHSCTLMASAREAHRQTERLMTLRAGNYCLDSLNYCTVGAQLCCYQAEQSMSVHAITDIPWEDWPDIMDRHGLSYHVAIFHYDPIMHTVSAGALEGGYMYYQVKRDVVNFHFDGDSSLDYSHSWSNFKKYTVPWCQQSKTTEYSYLYDIKSVQGGIAMAEIVRVPSRDLGMQVMKPLFGYVPMEDRVSISTYMYDLETQLSKDDPAAYAPVSLMVHKDMYQFLFMYGISNDTATPDKPMNLADFRAMARTYNVTRRYGEACISGSHKLGALEAYDVYDAIYHVVCRERALLAARSSVITKALLHKQKIPDVAISTISFMFPINATGAVLMAPGRVFEFYLHKFVDCWKQWLAGKLCAVSVKRPKSYFVLQPAGEWHQTGYVSNSPMFLDKLNRVDLDKPVEFGTTNDDFVDKLASGIGTPEPEIAEDFLGGPAFTGGASETVVGSEHSGARKKSFVINRPPDTDRPLNEDEYRDVVEDKADTLNDEATLNETGDVGGKALLQELRAIRSTAEPMVLDVKIEPDIQKLHSWYHNSMIEYAVYCYDVGRDVLSTLKFNAKEVFPGGSPNQRILDNLNVGQSLGVKVFTPQAGVLDATARNYAVGVDPFTSRIHRINKMKDGLITIKDMSVKYLVVSEQVKVFNSFALAKGVVRSLRSGYIPRYTMNLIDGVPGCGKTSEIVERFTLSDVVVSAVRESKDDTHARLLASGKFAGYEEDLKLRVRTPDSLIMHGFRAPGPVNNVFFDEGLLAFPGQIAAAMERLRPRNVYVYGDRFQIGVIDRSASLGTLMYRGIGVWTNVETRDTSHSLPADVAVILAKTVYGRTIYTTSPVARSLKFVQHKSVTDEEFVVATPGWDYMTVLTADKAKLLTGLSFVDGKKAQSDAVASGTGSVTRGKGNARVFTVHEAQGQRLDQTRVVRMNVNTAAIFNSKQHVVVAVSRHYYRCEYHSVGLPDPLSDIFTKYVTDSDMELIMKPPSKSSLERIERIKNGTQF